ncbi:MAG: hypothetical protein M3347_09040 [Armatimonadota bacterium]|nr:hypothetical protein [Armatimonadota bacterium]
MAAAKLEERKMRQKKSPQNSVAVLQAYLRQPPVLTSEEAQELEQIIQAERARGLTDFRNPLTGEPQ